jgi:hypothetical protein
MKRVTVSVSVAAASLLLVATPAAAHGTSNPKASCAAVVNSNEGPPGPSIQFLKFISGGVPGRVVAQVATEPHGDCSLPFES